MVFFAPVLTPFGAFSSVSFFYGLFYALFPLFLRLLAPFPSFSSVFFPFFDDCFYGLFTPFLLFFKKSYAVWCRFLHFFIFSRVFFTAFFMHFLAPKHSVNYSIFGGLVAFLQCQENVEGTKHSK